MLFNLMGMDGQITALAEGAPAKLPVAGGTPNKPNGLWLVIPGLGLLGG